MKTYIVEQGSAAWLQLRLGIPTASEFKRIITPAQLKLSSQARGYAMQLVAERLLGRPVVDIGNLPWVERGKELEASAVRMYEFELSAPTSPVGFITTDDGQIGASPDRLVDHEPGAVEIKCPAPHTHVGYMLDGFGPDYIIQAQGQMMVGGFEWVDRYSFYPELPPVRERTYRDEAIIAKLSDALDAFLGLRDELLRKALDMGAIELPPPASRPAARPGEGNYHTIIDPFAPGMEDYHPWAAS